MRPALLLIDLQGDYLCATGLQPSPSSLCAAATTLLEDCRATRIPVIHVATTIRTDDEGMPHWREARTPRCIAGTPGHAAPPALQPRQDEFVAHKQFFSAFPNADLEAHLRGLHVDTLILAGVHLRASVRTTAIDAYQRGFSVWIAEDAISDDDPLHAAMTRQYLSARFARFLTVSQICRLLAPGTSPNTSGDGAPPTLDLSALVIAGRSMQPVGLQRIDHISSRDGRTRLFRVPVCGSEQVEPAAADARRALREWSRLPCIDRRALLLNLAVCIEADAETLAWQIAVEIGKPLCDARQEVTFAIDLVRAAVSGAASVADSRSGAGWQVRRRPLGVVAVVTPWNNPLAIALGKIAPAIWHSNTVVWKPAPGGAAVALATLRLMEQAGLPPGVVNLVHGDHTTAERLISDTNIDAATLTGSSAAGYSAQVICARRQIPFQAELGGNNATIVWFDADLDHAAALIAIGSFGNAGQRCTATRRVIIDRSCSGRFLEQFQKAVAGLHWGDPLKEVTQVGPVVSEAALRRIAEVVDRARDVGATVLTPHMLPRPAETEFGGFYYPPTIVCCDDPVAEIVVEETFGPVVVVQEAASWEQALDLCNGVPQGLVACLFSRSPEREREFLAKAHAGLLKINVPTAGAAADAPFCGWKASGIGPPEHGAADVEFYSRRQTVYQTQTEANPGVFSRTRDGWEDRKSDDKKPLPR